MRSPNPDRSGRATPALTGRRTGQSMVRGVVAAGLAVAWLSTVLVGQNRTGSGAVRDIARASDVPPQGDLRCLTRRPEDCLATPVPVDEPHGADCATCHSLWDRGGKMGAIRSCTDGGCHPEPSSLAAFHATVGDATLTDCTACHLPHDFRITDNGTRCSGCHDGGGRAARQARTRPVRRLPGDLEFRHRTHSALACTACHSAAAAHGVLRISGVQDCGSCHHASGRDDDCARCHDRSEMDSLSFTVTRTLDIRIGTLERPTRTFIFQHARHSTAVCVTCHTGPGLRAPASTDCSSCHFQHHEPTSDCSACHERPAEGAHDRRSHLRCGGPGCHDPVPPGIEWAPRTRQLCLACHTDRADHKPGRSCADCHVLPPAAIGRAP